jgi:hypothetical protein
MGSERPFGLVDNDLAAKTAVGIRAIDAANTRVMPFTYFVTTLLSVVCQVCGKRTMVKHVAKTRHLPNDCHLLSAWTALPVCGYYRICSRTILQSLQLKDGHAQIVTQNN